MKTSNAGFNTGVVAITIALIWIGLLKFTAMEGMMIKHYIENSFLLSWMYKFLSVGAASMLIGTFEIITGFLILASFWFPQAGKIGGVMGIVIFFTTLSFLLTTPMTLKIAEGLPVTDFFLLKDLAFLAISVQVLERSQTKTA
ncbi:MULTISPECIES: DUF417 family protein [unclassified Mucilaginibacter]|uniref:DUF417 family protein n=1 Tax=unclassified Mucilaginibacter TaxID=2617802 RepID=UPI003396FB62